MFKRVHFGSLAVVLFAACSAPVSPPCPESGVSNPPATATPTRSVQLIMGLKTAALLRPSETTTIQRDGATYRPWFPATATRSPTAVVWPAEAESPFELTDLNSGAHIAVRLVGAARVDAEIVDGFATYLDVLPGASQVHRALADGTEDFIAFSSVPASHEVTYSVTLSESVAGLRFVAGVLEMLDSQGTPRLRMSPPFLVDAKGEHHDAEVAIEGCVYDTSPAPPWGRRPTAPESSECRVRISWNGRRIAWPAVLDPTWTSTWNMTRTRKNHQAAVTTTGRVLVADSGTAELFDPTTQTFAATAAPTQTAHGFILTALQNGKVVAVGGQGPTLAQSIETYDPATGTWAVGANLITPRLNHGAALLNNGKVLIFGGYNGAYLNAAELYDPATDTMSPTGFMGSPRAEFTYSVLTSGKVLASGGYVSSFLNTADIYDPATGVWAPAGSMGEGRRYHAQASLPGGGAMVIGGYITYYLVSTRIYDPTTNSWSNGPSLYDAVSRPTLTLTGNKLLAAGGYGSTYQNATRLYDEATNSWLASPSMIERRSGHVATVLLDGNVLVTGGSNSSGTLNSAEVYTHAIGCTSSSDCTAGHCVDGFCCDTDCSGGCNRCDLPAKEGTCTLLVSGQTSADPSCSPYLCDGASSDCPVACSADSACGVGYYCLSNQCVPKDDLGSPCQSPNECVSGRCADGVCCNVPCAGNCDACSAALGASSDGTCTALNGPGSPVCGPYMCNGTGFSCPSSCASHAQCVSGYYCDESSKCVLVKQIGEQCTSAAECAYGHCVDGRCCDTACDQPCDRCDQFPSIGTCTTASAGYNSGPCTPYACDGMSTECPTSCNDAGYCNSEYGCINGTCVPKLDKGEPCSSADECKSNYCVDGVCCNHACSGSCDACAVSLGASTDGTCSYVTGPGLPSCSGHACSGTSPYCPQTCSSDSDCTSEYACVAADCVAKKPNGDACTTAGDCASGFCVDGVCCNAACDGQCSVCSSAGSEGTCQATLGAPVGARPACGGTGPCEGVCGGVEFGACVYPHATTECAPASCTNGKEVGASLCDGIGGCVAGMEILCGPGGCAGDHCASDGGPEAGVDAHSDAAEDVIGTDALVEDSGADSAIEDAPVTLDSSEQADVEISDAAADTHSDGAPTNDSASQDADATVDAVIGSDSGSCGCRTPGGSGSSGWPLALMLVALWTSRRRVTPGPSGGSR